MLLAAIGTHAQEANPIARAFERAGSGADAAAANDTAAGNGALLPNGATSIDEAYEDWNVSCRVEDAGKLCAIRQVQGDARSGRPMFAIELHALGEDRAGGALLLPFGLDLEAGVQLGIDEQQLGQGARFSTCTPQGCLVPVIFPDAAIRAMKSGGKLTVAAKSVANEQEVVFTVSLLGFTAALDRVVMLSE